MNMLTTRNWTLGLGIALLLSGCGGGGGGSSNGGGGGGTASWGNTPLTSRQSHLATYGATLVHRIHPMQPGYTPPDWPQGKFLDVWQMGSEVRARYQHKNSPGDILPQEYYLTIDATERAAGDYYTGGSHAAIHLNPINTVLNPYYYTVTDISQNRAYWGADGQPRVLWSYRLDNTYNVADYTAPNGSGGQVHYGVTQAGPGARLWPLNGVHYGFGCSVYGVYDQPGQNGDTRGDPWMFTPDMVLPREDTRTYIYSELFQVVMNNTKPWGIQNFTPAACAENVLDDTQILLAYAYSTEPALPGYDYKGRVALVGYNGSAFTLIGHSAELPATVWHPELSTPTLKIVHDSTDPTRPYVLAIYQHDNSTLGTFRSEVRVYRLEGSTLVLRYTAAVGGIGLTLWPDTITVHNGQLIAHRFNTTTSKYELAMGHGDGLMASYKPGLLTANDQVTFIKSEGGDLYIGVQRKEDNPFVHWIGELVRID